MDPDLQRLHDEIHLITSGLSAEKLSWRTAGKWSAAQILEHLYRTYIGTIKGLSRVLASGVANKQATLRQRAAAMIVIQIGYFPSGVQSPAAVRPRGVPSEQVVAEIGPTILEMDRVLTSCASKFGENVKVLEHPFLGPFSVAQWRKFHLRHGMHHLKQIQRLRRLMAAAIEENG
jgi:hypothetical protein